MRPGCRGPGASPPRSCAAAGVCHVALGFEGVCAGWVGGAPEQVSRADVGVNHVTWERCVVVDGKDRLPELLTDRGADIAALIRQPEAILHLTGGTVPSYYLRYYYQHDEVVAELRCSQTRAAAVAEMGRKLLEMYADPALDRKPELLGQRGGAFYSEAAGRPPPPP